MGEELDGLGYRGTTAVVTGTVLYSDQGSAGGLWTGQIDPAVLSVE